MKRDGETDNDEDDDDFGGNIADLEQRKYGRDGLDDDPADYGVNAGRFADVSALNFRTARPGSPVLA